MFSRDVLMELSCDCLNNKFDYNAVSLIVINEYFVSFCTKQVPWIDK